VLPFGLKNAPAVFCRMMNMLLANLPPIKWFMDDIVIHSTSVESHLKQLRRLFNRLREVNIKLNAEKCTWLENKIKLLGHVVSNGKIEMDNEKLSVIRNRLKPSNVKQVQQFLGLCNYYRRFIKDFANISKPLYSLLSKDVPFVWSDSCEEAFLKLKDALTSYPVLRSPVKERIFTIYTDASGYALGAVLTQVDDNGNEYVCEYASRLLTKSEINYSITNKECLAVIFGITSFRYHVEGKIFRVVTDHIALSWLRTVKNPSGQLARWSLFLQAFDFEIVYRKGTSHENADALSRPVLVNAIEVVKDSHEELSSKGLDVYEDDYLKNYLVFKRHMDGASKKQVKRVETLAKSFYWENNQFWYVKEENDEPKLVPRPEERSDIILRAHLLGHFGIGSTINRIRERYYWKNLDKDVESLVKQCLQCKRNNKQKIVHHKGIAIRVYKIGDRIGIDIVFCVENDQGYIGMVVITEYVTKNAFAKAIKSKSAAEVARVLWEYFCLFGPANFLQSDQGTEFLNEVIKHLLKLAGTEHRVTSPYNPRTNGLTERFNQTLCDALRKHAETCPNDWHLWIDFILLSYRSRVNSITGFTPFELTFGRRMNTFDFDVNKLSPHVEEQDAILARAYDIKNQYENTVEKALANINKKQEAQMKYQDKRVTVEEKELPVNQEVYLKCEGLLSKLEARFKGPFYVTGVTKRGNYKLKDALGDELEQSYPRHKIKVVENSKNPHDSVEVEKIIDHKEVNNKKLFLVKWKDLPDAENSWVPEDHFDTIEIIKEYWNKLEGRPAKRGRGRPRKQVASINLTSLIYLAMTWMLFLQIACTKIDGNFLTCTSNKGKPINVDNMCIDYQKFMFPNVTLRGNLNSSSIYPLNLLGKTRYKILVTGFECFKEKTRIVTYKTFFGYHLTMSERFSELVSLEDCHEMVKDGRCVKNKNELKCVNNICNYADTLEIDHYWLRTKVYEGFECSTRRRLIKAQNLDDSIFESDCKVSNGFCRLAKSIIVWNTESSVSCPFYFIGNAEFIADGYNFISHDGKLAFETITASVECGTTFYETSSGIFLSPNIPQNLISEQIKKEVFLSEETSLLNLADSDYFKYKSEKEIEKIKLNNCLLYKLLLKSKISKDNIMLLENEREKMVIRFTNNNIFRIDCNEIQQIIINNSSKCFDKLSISYVFDSKIQTGFLGSQGLITSSANLADCSNLEEYFSIPNSKLTIIRNGTRVSISNSNNAWLNLNLAEDSEKVSLYHSKMLMEEIQKQEDFERVIATNDMKSLSHVQTIEEESFLRSFLSGLWSYSLTRMASVIFIIIAIYVGYKLILRSCKMRNNSNTKGSINETIAMEINIGTKDAVRVGQVEEDKEKAISKLWESLPSKQN